MTFVELCCGSAGHERPAIPPTHEYVNSALVMPRRWRIHPAEGDVIVQPVTVKERPRWAPGSEVSRHTLEEVVVVKAITTRHDPAPFVAIYFATARDVADQPYMEGRHRRKHRWTSMRLWRRSFFTCNGGYRWDRSRRLHVRRDLGTPRLLVRGDELRLPGYAEALAAVLGAR